MSKYELADRAYHIARHVLAKPVGKQDEYASAFGGLNYIRFHRDGSTVVEPLELDPELLREFQDSLMLFFTGAAHNSWTILKEQEESTRTRQGVAVDSLHTIRELADSMRALLLAGDLRRFGELLHEEWKAKKAVSCKVSNPHIDQLYEAARRNGAIGGKITGAGGGGFLLLFCPMEEQEQVRTSLFATGAHELAFEFDSLGAHVLVDDPFVDADERSGMRWCFVRPGDSLEEPALHSS